jgi:hypothetical protein
MRERGSEFVGAVVRVIVERGQSRVLTQFKKSHFSGTIVRGIEGPYGWLKKSDNTRD